LNREAPNSIPRLACRRARDSYCALMLSVVLLASGLPQRACAQPATQEYKVKAAFVFHFAQLVEWPAGALSPVDSGLSICIFDDEPRLQELESTLEGKPLGIRVLHVRLLNKQQPIQGCNILFLSRDEGKRQAAVLRDLRGQPILTIGETDSFISDGGMIRLHIEEDKIRFDINVDGANASHLKISSRLLLLATTITLGGERARGR
jgi:YfiR/HmsC-like